MKISEIRGRENWADFCHELPRIDTKAEARFVKISEIRGREKKHIEGVYPMPLQPGMILENRYRVEALLGQG
ncbi:MAG: hypothetical protein WBF31_01690, partial [Anaerolineae bacterium]